MEFLYERSNFRLFTLPTLLELMNKKNRFNGPIVLNQVPPDVFDSLEFSEPTGPQDSPFVRFQLQADSRQGFVATQDKFMGIPEFPGDGLMDWRKLGSNSFFRFLVTLGKIKKGQNEFHMKNFIICEKTAKFKNMVETPILTIFPPNILLEPRVWLG